MRNWRRLGFDETDVAGEGSDRLVDELVAWGAPEQISERVEAHRATGHHIAFQALGDDPLVQLRALAPAIV
jgi:hypothetical protein